MVVVVAKHDNFNSGASLQSPTRDLPTYSWAEGGVTKRDAEVIGLIVKGKGCDPKKKEEQPGEPCLPILNSYEKAPPRRLS